MCGPRPHRLPLPLGQRWVNVLTSRQAAIKLNVIADNRSQTEERRGREGASA
jgi:hypothetical protein